MTISSHLFIHFWPFMFSKFTKRVFPSPIFGILLPISERRLKEMRKIFAGVVLPLLTATAIIGSGFSVWWFQGGRGNMADTSQTLIGGVTNDSQNIAGYQFAPKSIAGLQIVFDQKTAPTGKDPNAENLGVHFVKDSNASWELKLGKLKTSNSETDPIAKTVITVPALLDKYIVFNGKTGVSNIAPTDPKTGVDRTYTFDWDAWVNSPESDQTYSKTITWNFNTVIRVDWRVKPAQNPGNTIGEPKTQAELDQFRKDWEASKNNLKITYRAGYNL